MANVHPKPDSARAKRAVAVCAALAGLFGLLGASLHSFASPDKQTREEKKRQKAIQKEMESPYKKWLEDEVPYIITDEERAAFKKLTTDEEREQFIEQFWERRNPNPGSPENEFKEEYYRRIAYANEHFASGIPGWRTDRGRIYIMYGPPDEIESHPSGGTYEVAPGEIPIEGPNVTSQMETYPFEDWTYNYIEGIGNNVKLEFVDPTMSGEYHLSMNPCEKDALAMVPGDTTGCQGPVSIGSVWNPTSILANSVGGSSSVITGMGPENMEEFTRLDTFAKIFKPPVVKFSDLRASVTHKITSQIVPFEVRTDFIRVTPESVLTPVTVQVANKDLEFQNKDGVMHAVLDIYGQLSTLGGRVATTFEDSVVLDVPQHDFQGYVNRKSVYQKAVPLRPGHYKLSLVVKDETSGNIGSTDLGLIVPQFDDGKLSNSSLILADLIQQLPTSQVGTGPFVIGGTKVRPSVSGVFTRDQNLGIYMQVYNLSPDPKTHRPSAEIQYDLTRDGKPVFTKSEEAQTAQVTISKSLPLKPLEPGKYTLEIKITDNVSKQSLSPSASFQVQ